MRVAKLKTICIAILTLLAVAIGLLFIPKSTPLGVEAQVIEVNVEGIESKLALNSEINVPTSIKVNYNGEKDAINGVVVCPDGKIVNAGKIKVNQMGVYQLRYYFVDAGVTHTAVQNVEVYSDYFSLSNPAGGEIRLTDDDTKLNCGKDGIFVDLKSGTSFVYNKVLDLRECDEDGLSPIIELDTRYGEFVNDVYKQNVLEAWVRLTDCYNPNVYIELRMQNSELYTGHLYPGVKTNMQPVTGMDKGVTQVLGTSRIITLDGFKYRVWQSEGSMNVGLYSMKTALTTGAIWKYDMETNRVYLTYNENDNFLVSDLDEPLIYTDGKYFPGFTTGEVYVSIYANGYQSSLANTEIISIGHDNMYDVAGKEYVDTVAPAIVVDSAKTTASGVYGAVGDTFTIPTAKAVDVNILPGVDVAVYRGYGTNYQTAVSVNNNQFLLSQKDLYTIVYTAKDKTGNVGREIFTVNTLDTLDNRAVTLIPMDAGTVPAGVKIDNLYQVSNALNVDTDDVKVKIFVEHEKQTLSGEGETFSFIPYYEGTYKIRYQYTDGVFTYEKVVNLQCAKSNTVSFLDTANIPKYYLQGNYYAVDDIKAYTFTNGYPETVATEIYAIFDNGAEQKITNPAKVQITGTQSVRFLYKAQNAETMVTDEASIIVSEYRNASNKLLGYDMSKFFVGDYTANALKDDGKRSASITYTSNKMSGDNKLSYFNSVSGRTFSMEFKVGSGEDNFASLRVTLTDALNETNKLYVEIFKNEDANYISVNGGALTKLETLTQIGGTILKVSYDYDSKFVRMNDYSTIVDFNARTVYLDIEMLGITDKSSIIISNINNTSIAGNKYTDSYAPEIYVYDFQGDYKVGDVVKVSIPEFSDVISGVDYSRASLIIACADGSPVYDVNGNVLTNLVCGESYEVRLDRIAKFYVVYEIYDFSDNNASKTITLNCVDTTAPNIELQDLQDGQTLIVKANDAINFNFTVSDNITKAKNIITYIHLYCIDMYSYVPNVTNIKPTDVPDNGVYNQTFSIAIKGNYEAQIHAIDAEGNLRVVRISIIVE